jgi:ribosomal protein S27E
MCSYNTLHVNDDGYVVKCNSCRHFQVAFGTTVLVFTKDEFLDFCEIVNAETNEWYNDGFPQSKSIFIPTKCRDVALIFSYKEILKLHHVLANASLILQAHELLSENERNQLN